MVSNSWVVLFAHEPKGQKNFFYFLTLIFFQHIFILLAFPFPLFLPESRLSRTPVAISASLFAKRKGLNCEALLLLFDVYIFICFFDVFSPETVQIQTQTYNNKNIQLIYIQNGWLGEFSFFLNYFRGRKNFHFFYCPFLLFFTFPFLFRFQSIFPKIPISPNPHSSTNSSSSLEVSM